MSDVMSDYNKQLYELELKCERKLEIQVSEPPAKHVMKQMISESDIAFGLKIPYPLLHHWHNEIEREGFDYIDFLNASTGAWFQVNRETGNRIQGRLEREAGAVASKYKKTKGSRREKLNYKSYTLSIYHNELLSVDELKEELDLTQRELSDWKNKYSDLESEKQQLMKEMSEALKQKEDEIGELQTVNEQLESYIEKIKHQSGLTCQSKKIGDVGSKQRGRKLKQLKERAECALWFAKSFGLEISCLKFKDSENNEDYSFDYQKTPSTSSAENNPEQSEKDNSNIEQILFLLDKFYVSDEFYHELTVVYKDMPRSYLIKQMRSNLNSICHIESIPGSYPGAQCSFKSLVRQHVTDYLTANPDHDPKKEMIKIKISIDGAKMSRTTNFVILSFSLLQNEESVMSSKGNRTIAVVNGPENYSTIQNSLSKSLEEINDLIDQKKIDINGNECKLEIFLGGDYKILLIVMGLSGATSDYACLWCKVHRLSRYDMSKPRDYYTSSPHARTHEELLKMYSLPKSKFKCSCENKPLFTIDLDHVILDELHLMLRVTDRLTGNLIKEVMERDSNEDIYKKKKEDKGKYLGNLIKLINNTGVTFNVWEKTNADGKGSGMYDWTSLLGSDKKTLMKTLPRLLETNDILFPETKETVIRIWTDFYTLYQKITDPSANAATATWIFDNGKKWIELYCSLAGLRKGFENARVTPYMHCIPYHIPKFIDDHGPLKMFTGQGVEKNNDDAKKLYFQKSNKWDATRDVLQLEARQYALRDHEREKSKYTKRKTDYWESEIKEARHKKAREIQTELAESDEPNQPGSPAATPEPQPQQDITKMTVQELKMEIKARGIKVKGLSKMNKKKLLNILK